MAKVTATHIFATAPSGSSAPDSITTGDGAIWVEYGNGADSTGAGGKSTIVEYGSHGQIEHSYTITGLADGLKYNPTTGDVWALLNNDGNAKLALIDPATQQVSYAYSYASPYVYGANSSRGFDDVVFDGKTVFMSETNPANPGDPVVVELVNGNDPFGKLVTTNVLSFGDQGINLATGKLQTLPITDPDSLKLLPNGSLLLTGEADGAFIFINHPGTAQQTASFVDLPKGFVPDDAIMPTSTAGTFYISNQAGNDIEQVQVKGLNTHDLYVDVSNKNELVQLDPTTGKVTTLLTGLDSPHGLAFVPAATKHVTNPTPPKSGNGGDPDAPNKPQVLSTHIFAVAPSGSSAPDSITTGDGAVWVEYGNGADSAGAGGKSTIVEYGSHGQIEHSYTITGLADGLKYNPTTGDVWALLNNDGNAKLALIDPATQQVSYAYSYASPYVYGANSSRGFDDVVFDGKTVFMSETNPANPGDPVVVELVNGNAPFGKLVTTNVLSFGDQGINLATGKLQTLPITDPDSLKLLPNGSLLLTGEADGAFIFINHPGTSQQTTSFVDLPKGFVPDDAIMPTSTAGTFYISNQAGNDIEQVQVKGLNTHDLYVDVSNKNELVQLDPTTGKVTTLLTGLDSPHGLAFVPAATKTTPTPSLQELLSQHTSAALASIVRTLLPTTPKGAVTPPDITKPSGGSMVQLSGVNTVPFVLDQKTVHAHT